MLLDISKHPMSGTSIILIAGFLFWKSMQKGQAKIHTRIDEHEDMDKKEFERIELNHVRTREDVAKIKGALGLNGYGNNH